MNPSQWLLRGRQLFGFLVPGAVWVLSGVLLMNFPSDPVELISEMRPSWVEATAFFGLSYVAGFAMREFSSRFAEWTSKAFAWLTDASLIRRTEDLEKRVLQIVDHRYGTIAEYVGPSSDRVFGFCKRILRGSAPELYRHLDIYEEEINLLGLIPLPMIVFCVAWLASWYYGLRPGFEKCSVCLMVALTIPATAIFCLAQFRPLRQAERKEVFESFIAFHFEQTVASMLAKSRVF
ncbi:MAG TPA: hypothetical protein VF647_17865 [Longimicrobium sp.]|jgi:hypothetical protein